MERFWTSCRLFRFQLNSLCIFCILVPQADAIKKVHNSTLSLLSHSALLRACDRHSREWLHYDKQKEKRTRYSCETHKYCSTVTNFKEMEQKLCVSRNFIEKYAFLAKCEKHAFFASFLSGHLTVQESAFFEEENCKYGCINKGTGLFSRLTQCVQQSRLSKVP
jgi:hypothetical protein